MEKNKMTKKMVIEEMLANSVVQAQPEWVNFLKTTLEQMEKKVANAKKKRGADDSTNAEYKAEILAVLGASDTPVTVTEIQNASEVLRALSNQKVTALVGSLVAEEKVSKSIEGRKSMFSIAEPVED